MESSIIMENVVFQKIYLTDKQEIIKIGDTVLCNVLKNGAPALMQLAISGLKAVGMYNNLGNECRELLEKEDQNDAEGGDADGTQNSPPSTSTERKECEISKWCDKRTSFLIKKSAEYMAEVGPMMRFKKKKDLFIQLAQDLAAEYNVFFTGDQCETRLKTVKRRRNGCMRSNRMTGNTRTKIEFEEEFQQLAAVDDSFQPEVLIGAGRIQLNAKEKPTRKDSKKRPSLEDTILKIHQERESNKRARFEEKEAKKVARYEETEQNKRARHAEKMAILRQLINNCHRIE